MDLPLSVQTQAQEAQQIEQQMSGQPMAPESKPQESVQGSEDTSRAEQRYNTLRGMYRADQGRWRDQMTQKDREIQELRARLSEYEAGEGVAQETQKRQSLITEADKENFGEDMYDFVQRSVDDKLDGLEQTRKEVAELKQQLQNQQQAERDWKATQFREELSQMAPGWEQQNVDRGFIAWLQEPDPFSGIPRQEILNRATTYYDAATTAKLFNAYKIELANSQRQKSNQLARQVAPAQTRHVPVSTDQTKPIWTEADIKNFYDAKRRHEFTAEEAQRIEKEIDLAVSEGRVRT